MRLDELGEFGFLARLQAALPADVPGVLLGSGDDAAVLAFGDRYLVVSTDAMVEDRHFRRDWLGPAEIGERAARAALSDLAAMGALPRGIFASVALPPDLEVAEAEALCLGLEAGAVAAGVHLLGGDLAASPGPLFLDVTAVGETTRYWTRAGARPGDLVLVSGELGASAAALARLEAGEALADLPPDLRERFVQPQPAFDLVAALQPLGVVTAALDISDGLLADLGHLATTSAVGVRLAADRVPIAESARIVAEAVGRDAVALALASGEEYELALAIAPEALESVQQAVKRCGARAVTVVGEVTREVGGVVAGGPAPPSPGWDHFRSTAP